MRKAIGFEVHGGEEKEKADAVVTIALRGVSASCHTLVTPFIKLSRVVNKMRISSARINKQALVYAIKEPRQLYFFSTHPSPLELLLVIEMPRATVRSREYYSIVSPLPLLLDMLKHIHVQLFAI